MRPPVDYFCSESLQLDLKGKTVRGGLVTAGSQAIVVVLRLAAVPILARILDPTDFGLVAMVTVFTGLAATFVDAGLSMSTVQQEHITSQQTSNLFWVAVCAGVGVAIGVCAISPAISWFYDEPRLTVVTIVLTASFVFSGLTVQHQALLLRTHQFTDLAIRNVVEVLLANTLAVYIAWQTRSYWALVALPVAQAFVRMVMTLYYCRWLPSFPRRGAGVRGMLAFGANLTGANMANYLASVMDRAMIGRFLGAEATGLYDQAWKLLIYPLRQINGALSSVMAPILSRATNGEQTYSNTYMGVVNALLIVIIPIFSVMVACPTMVVRAAFGPGWEDSAPILQALALGSAALTICNSTGWLFISQGRVVEFRRWQTWDALARPLLILAGLYWGTTGVAASYSIRTVVSSAVLCWYVGRSGPMRVTPLLGQLLRSHIVLIGCVLAAYTAAQWCSDLPFYERLLVACVAASLASLALNLFNTGTRRLIFRLPTILNQHVLRKTA